VEINVGADAHHVIEDHTNKAIAAKGGQFNPTMRLCSPKALTGCGCQVRGLLAPLGPAVGIVAPPPLGY
jgi:hypothetical protein